MTSDETLPRLVVLGELNADIVVRLDDPPAFGQTERIVPSTEIVLGSSSAITACGAAAMGVPTSLVSVVGSDLLGEFVLSELRAHDVDVSSCRLDPSLPTGTSTILTLPDGSRSILTALGTIGAVSRTDVPPELLAGAGHLHVGSYFLQDGLHADLADLFADCRSGGISTSVDPNDDPRNEWDSGIRGLLPHTDVFFCNEDEALAISGATDISAAIDWFAARMPAGSEIVAKLGSAGATVAVCGPAGVQESHTVKPEAVDQPLVDTVGAGDSLAAGYLAARLRGLGVADRLQIGVRNGTAATRATGGIAGQLSWGAVTSDRGAGF